MKNKWVILFIFALCSGLASAQNIDDYLDSYLGKNKDGYVQPISDVLTGLFNTGLILEPRIDSSFYFKISLVGSAGLITDNLKTFSATTEEPFSPEQTTTVSTILGRPDITVLTDTNGLSYTFPAGLGVKFVPFAMPQITVGGFLHSEINVRFLAYDFKGDFGKFQLLGLALRHDVGHYFHLDKFYLNGGYSFQSIKLGKRINVTNHLISVDGGQEFRYFFYYGRLGYQSGNMHVDYTLDPEEGGNNIEFKNQNAFPLFAGLGGGVKLGKVFRFNLGVNYAQFPMAEAGITLKF